MKIGLIVARTDGVKAKKASGDVLFLPESVKESELLTLIKDQLWLKKIY